jgi:hypothetical protein
MFPPVLKITILLALLSWLIIPIINDARAKRRERENRKESEATAKENRRLEFVRFLKQWKTEVELFRHPTHIGTVGSHPVEIKYREKVPDFISAIHQAHIAFGNGQFDALTKRLAGLDGKDFNQGNPRGVILEAIDALLKFAEKT